MSQRSETTIIPDVLPLIPLRDLSLFPNLVVPLFVGRERSIKALEEAMREDHLVALATQRKAETQDPGAEDIYEIGCVATVMQELKLPDGTAKALVEGQQRFRIVEYRRRPTRSSSCASSSSRSRARSTSRPRRSCAPWSATSSTPPSSASRSRRRSSSRHRRSRSRAGSPTSSRST